MPSIETIRGTTRSSGFSAYAETSRFVSPAHSTESSDPEEGSRIGSVRAFGTPSEPRTTPDTRRVVRWPSSTSIAARAPLRANRRSTIRSPGRSQVAVTMRSCPPGWAETARIREVVPLSAAHTQPRRSSDGTVSPVPRSTSRREPSVPATWTAVRSRVTNANRLRSPDIVGRTGSSAVTSGAPPTGVTLVPCTYTSPPVAASMPTWTDPTAGSVWTGAGPSSPDVDSWAPATVTSTSLTDWRPVRVSSSCSRMRCRRSASAPSAAAWVRSTWATPSSSTGTVGAARSVPVRSGKAVSTAPARYGAGPRSSARVTAVTVVPRLTNHRTSGTT